MKKLVAVLVILGLLASCSTQKPTAPLVQKPSASGTPMGDGDGGGGDPSGGDPYYMNVAITPQQSVVPHEGDIWITLSDTGDNWPHTTAWPEGPAGFNAYDFRMAYDTTKVYPVNLLTPADANGCLFTGACAGTNGVYACGGTIQFLTFGPDPNPPYGGGVPLPANEVNSICTLACYHTDINGPGDIYSFHFKARPDAIGSAAFHCTKALFASPNAGPVVDISGVQCTVTIGGAY
jgi:hypothetical protein